MIFRPRLARIIGITLTLCALAACGCIRAEDGSFRLPTGARLDPAGRRTALGALPLAGVFSPDSSRIVALLCGYRTQGLQVIDAASGRVTQTLAQPAAFIGLAFSPDGRTLFASGGVRDLVYRYAWRDGRATLLDSVSLKPQSSTDYGSRYAAGLALSPDGARLYVAENIADSLAVIDVASGRVLQHVATGSYPYAVVVDRAGRVFVSVWGDDAIATFTPAPQGLIAGARIAVGRHPSAMALNRSGSRLYVTRASFDRIGVIDTQRDRLLTELSVTPAGAPSEGATPNALALSPDGRHLWVAEADHNAAALFALSAANADDPAAGATDTLLARVPVEWYPTAVLARGEQLYVLNGKGLGTSANPRLNQPGTPGQRDPMNLAIGQLSGSLSTITLDAHTDLAALTQRVANTQGWNATRDTLRLPSFAHVIYVIKENRTYDQILGDLPGADGDTSLVYFPRNVTPNHHALAERFGIFDRFFVNAEVSGQGHNWSTAAYSSDFVEKTLPSNYSGRGRSYDFEGLNRNVLPDDDAAEPGNGYLWDAAIRAGVSLRDYGEFTRRVAPGRWAANKASLAPYTCAEYPGWDLDITDQVRIEAWLREFARFVANDSLPQLSIVRLPNDHTSGARIGAPTPRAYVADNDLALGRMIEALSHSKYWSNTVVFVLEDDAQDGPDHVDSHRSPLFVISAWNRPGVIHRFANTTDVLASIDAILHLTPLSQFDYYGRPLAGIFATTPDARPYTALRPGIALDELNVADTTGSHAMRELDLRREDPANEDLFNRILWANIKGPSRPYPGVRYSAFRGLGGERFTTAK